MGKRKCKCGGELVLRYLPEAAPAGLRVGTFKCSVCGELKRIRLTLEELPAR